MTTDGRKKKGFSLFLEKDGVVLKKSRKKTKKPRTQEKYVGVQCIYTPLPTREDGGVVDPVYGHPNFWGQQGNLRMLFFHKKNSLFLFEEAMRVSILLYETNETPKERSLSSTKQKKSWSFLPLSFFPPDYFAR